MSGISVSDLRSIPDLLEATEIMLTIRREQEQKARAKAGR